MNIIGLNKCISIHDLYYEKKTMNKLELFGCKKFTEVYFVDYRMRYKRIAITLGKSRLKINIMVIKFKHGWFM